MTDDVRAGHIEAALAEIRAKYPFPANALDVAALTARHNGALREAARAETQLNGILDDAFAAMALDASAEGKFAASVLLAELEVEVMDHFAETCEHDRAFAIQCAE